MEIQGMKIQDISFQNLAAADLLNTQILPSLHILGYGDFWKFINLSLNVSWLTFYRPPSNEFQWSSPWSRYSPPFDPNGSKSYFEIVIPCSTPHHQENPCLYSHLLFFWTAEYSTISPYVTDLPSEESVQQIFAAPSLPHLHTVTDTVHNTPDEVSPNQLCTCS